ncbi:hypothetical protein F5879DRAFT_926048, partial [Lentinula edodes]
MYGCADAGVGGLCCSVEKLDPDSENRNALEKRVSNHIKDQRATEEVCILNVQPVDEDENEFDSSMNIPTIMSHAGSATVEEELGDDDWEECADIYQELLDGCRQ